MTGPGYFIHLSAGHGLPESLKNSLPDLLWLSELPTVSQQPSPDSVAVFGELHGCDRQIRIPLVLIDDDETLRTLFNVSETIKQIQLESYHGGLQPTAEMRLPFNYSILPPWVKGIARKIRGPSNFKPCDVKFPSDTVPAVVDWLCELREVCRRDCSNRPVTPTWPNGKRAAVVVTHDVDTDWLFRNPAWLERFCDAEESAGLKGAWYCVPQWSGNRHSERGMQRLLERGCEVGCHGFNHDAKWPLCNAKESNRRLRLVKKFAETWNMKGFRSEWLWRTPQFLEMLAAVFQYDTSVPTFSDVFTSASGNGCGTVLPYRTHGNLIELPLTLPMDEDVHRFSGSLQHFWNLLVSRAKRIIDAGGLVVFSFHPQPHQAANDLTLSVATAALKAICDSPNVWLTRPDQVAAWLADGDHQAATSCEYAAGTALS
jgi:hypothetical protein